MFLHCFAKHSLTDFKHLHTPVTSHLGRNTFLRFPRNSPDDDRLRIGSAWRAHTTTNLALLLAAARQGTLTLLSNSSIQY